MGSTAPPLLPPEQLVSDFLSDLTSLEAIEVGQEFVGAEVVSVMPYGCFVRLQEGIDALVHVSQFSRCRTRIFSSPR